MITRKRRAASIRRYWFLESYMDQNHSLRRIPLNQFPYRVGRQEGLELTLMAGDISRVHAEIDVYGKELVIRDLGSTNGTFVNHEPVRGERRLREGDILHLANLELRLVSVESDVAGAQNVTRHGAHDGRGGALPGGTRELGELLAADQVDTLFQPIFSATGDVHGWELLGRGRHPGLPEAPGALFRIAESAGREVALSRCFRRRGLDQAAALAAGNVYFFNTHPRELEDSADFLKDMATVRAAYPALGLVVELHEAAFPDLAALAELRRELAGLNIHMAFDDFGAGQARLVELAEVPPRYIKVDISLVRDLDKAGAARRGMVEMVLETAHRVGSLVVAEGVSRAGEAQACRDLGFDLLQGFHLGRPQDSKALKRAAFGR